MFSTLLICWIWTNNLLNNIASSFITFIKGKIQYINEDSGISNMINGLIINPWIYNSF